MSSLDMMMVRQKQIAANKAQVDVLLAESKRLLAEMEYIKEHDQLPPPEASDFTLGTKHRRNTTPVESYDQGGTDNDS